MTVTVTVMELPTRGVELETEPNVVNVSGLMKTIVAGVEEDDPPEYVPVTEYEYVSAAAAETTKDNDVADVLSETVE